MQPTKISQYTLVNLNNKTYKLGQDATSTDDSNSTSTNTTTSLSSPSSGDFLGIASVKYETGVDKGDPAMVSNGASWGDPGGTSYGIPQFATNTGSAKSFVNKLMDNYPVYKKYFAGKQPGTQSFNEGWKKAAADRGDEFRALQLDTIYDGFYTPWRDKMKSLYGVDIDRDRALQEAGYSISVQHGMNSAKKYGRGTNGSMSTEAILNKLYSNRKNLAAYPTTKRWNNELNDVKAYVGRSPIGYSDADYLNKYIKADARGGADEQSETIKQVVAKMQNDNAKKLAEPEIDPSAMGGGPLYDTNTLSAQYAQTAETISNSIAAADAINNGNNMSYDQIITLLTSINQGITQIAGNTANTNSLLVNIDRKSNIATVNTTATTNNATNNTVSAGNTKISKADANAFTSRATRQQELGEEAMRRYINAIAKGN